MRSQGQVRFIKISTNLQAVAAVAAVILLAAWLATMTVMSVMSYNAKQNQTALIDREAKVASAESRVTKYRSGIDSVADDLAHRQKFIESMVEAHIGTLPKNNAADETVTDSTNEARKTIRKVSAAIPEAADLVRIEARQLAFVERLTRYADRRAEDAAQAIRKLGLNPNAMIASSGDRAAKGGPFMRLATNSDGTLDPRFKRLGFSLSRMDALERSLAGIPQVQPANMKFISSGFGYRSDPFNGGAAFHAGLDFKGPTGTPIYAAAKGKVVFAGRKQGYGKCVEVDHGNGLMTRYAHMSRFRTARGEKVKAGEVIGAIGSTGRSTGPHLHFEVRINNRAVNPRPFLEKTSDVQQEARTGA
ncbi:MAG: M23 family metallopeptidase [Sphingomonadaceae bacterium]|nr:M23 family metallopeptidase [Sphingomonadaceae bacterium]